MNAQHLSNTPWSVRSLLFAVFGAVSLLVTAVAAVAFFKLSEADLGMQRVADRLYPQAVLISSTDGMVIRISLEVRHAMLARTAAERDEALARIGSLRKELVQTLDLAEAKLSTDEGRKRFAEVRKASANFWRLAEAMMPSIMAGDVATGMTMLVDEVAPARNAFLAALDHQQAWQAELVETTTAQAIARTQRVEALVLACAILSILTGVVASLWLSRRFERALGGEPHEAVAALRAVADGDLATEIRVRGGVEDSVMATVVAMRQSLTRLVSDVRRSVDGVAATTQQIAQGNADLSQRTEAQAAGVQQAAGAMVQMTESVRASAENARQATEITAGASTAAGRGGEVVREVVSTMAEIQGASRRIADITATIDGIAFQTNILALNAAVEAARAGEQGRGFAVVAAEVRSLAKRSAEAAREVKGLISDSVEKVDAGHELVAQAGQAMEDIVVQVGRVDALIAQIAAASAEQSQGIVSVDDTVRRIDGSTRQNASLVDASAAATESLRLQSEQLHKAVGVFRLAPQV